jgi:hypothetical protein
MAHNPCLKLYEIVKKQTACLTWLKIAWRREEGSRSSVEQKCCDFHFFETVSGTTKLTI